MIDTLIAELMGRIRALEGAVEDLGTREGGPVKIAQTSVSVAAANIDFTSIPSSFKHLRLEIYARGDTAATTTAVGLTFNADGGANYDRQDISCSAAVITASETFGETSFPVAVMAAASAGANLFTQVSAQINHYANSANNKVLRTDYARKIGTSSGNLLIVSRGGFWRSNAAITRITLTPAAGNFEVGTVATLYGLP